VKYGNLRRRAEIGTVVEALKMHLARIRAGPPAKIKNPQTMKDAASGQRQYFEVRELSSVVLSRGRDRRVKQVEPCAPGFELTGRESRVVDSTADERAGYGWPLR